MIRQWLPQDLSAIADIWLHLRSLSEWAKWPEIETPKEDIVKWLLHCMTKTEYTCFVEVNDHDQITACVGVHLTETLHPPHIRQLSEWCLWGEDKRSLVELWRLARQWGKGRGAILAQRGIINEYGQHLKWEKL